MNAKEISDATLESVTPADDDLMLIYDTSEGTTGKATIANVAPKVAESLAPQIDNRIIAKINTLIKRGVVTIPESTLGVSAVEINVTFDTQFDDANYAIVLTRSAYTYYANTSIVYFSKTKKGFSIQEWDLNNQDIRPAHQVSWLAMKI